MSVGLLGAIFVSNLPEGIGSAAAMRAGGRTRREVTILWIAVAAICTLASGIGFAIADTASDTLQGAINGFAVAAGMSGIR